MMQPFIKAGLSYLISILVVSYFSVKLNVIVLIILFCILLTIFLFKGKSKNYIYIIPIIIAISFNVTYTNKNYSPISSLQGQSLDVTAKLLDIEKTNNGKYKYIFESDKNNNLKKSFKFNVYNSDIVNIEYDDKITSNITFFDNSLNESGFENYNKSNGVFISGYFSDKDSINITKAKNHSFNYYILKYRDNMKDFINQKFESPNKDIIIGMLFGDTSGIDYDTKLSFNRTGLSHIFATSGLHVVILSYVILLVLGLFKINLKLKYSLCIFLIFIFMAMVGFSTSVVRAGIMIIILYLSRIFEQNYNSINSLILAGIIITISNPYSVLSLGFQLSFLATLGILYVYPKLNLKLIYKLKINNVFLKFIVKTILLSFSITITTLPITLFNFNEISLISPITNLITYPIMAVTVSAGFVILFLFLINLSFITTPLIYILGLGIKFLISIANSFSNFNFTYVPLGFDFVKLWFIVSLIAVLILIKIYKNKKIIKPSLIMTSLFLIIGIVSYNASIKDILNITILNQGDGKSVIATYNDTTILLYCGGSEHIGDLTTNYLHSKGIKDIELITTFSTTKTYSQGVPEILSRFNTQNIVVNEKGNMYNSILENQNNSKIILSDDLDIGLTNKIHIKNYEDKTSTVVLCYNNFNIVIGNSVNSILDLQQNYTFDIVIFGGEINQKFYEINSPQKIILKEQNVLEENNIKSFENSKTDIIINNKGNFKIRRN